jgi:hypothetical protein
MARAPNQKKGRAKAGRTIPFQPHEVRMMKINTPGPSGKIGGMGGMENHIVRTVDRTTWQCWLDAVLVERLIRYCQKYEKGGPNQRLRDACIPALRRIGIDLAPKWRAP